MKQPIVAVNGASSYEVLNAMGNVVDHVVTRGAATAVSSDLSVVKLVTVHANNAQHGLPAILRPDQALKIFLAIDRAELQRRINELLGED